MYITQHALNAYADDFGPITNEDLLSLAQDAIQFGKRRNTSYIHNDIVFCFNGKFDTLKTVYRN